MNGMKFVCVLILFVFSVLLVIFGVCVMMFMLVLGF